MDDEFLESISGAGTAEAAAAILYERCDDPATTDRAGCRDAVQQFFASAPVRLVDHGNAGCRADWEAGHLVLAGADCVSTFHLVDADDRPLDPAVLPPDGLLPDSAGIDPRTVDPPGEPSSPRGGPTDGEQPAEQFPPPPSPNDPDFNKFEGTQNLEAALRGLYMDCQDPDRPDPENPEATKPVQDVEECKRIAREFLAAALQRAVYSTEEPTGDGACEADWDDAAVPPRLVLRGSGCGSAFLLKNSRGEFLTDEEIRAATENRDTGETEVPLPRGTDVVEDEFEAVAECAEEDEASDDVAACREELAKTLPPTPEGQRPPYNASGAATDGTTDSDTDDSDTADSDSTDTDSTDSDTDSDSTDTDTADSDSTDTDSTDSGTTDTDSADSDTDSDSTDTDSTDSDTDSDSTDTDSTDSDSTDTDSTDSDSTDTDSTDTDSTDSDTTDSDTADPDTADSDSTDSDSTDTDTTDTDDETVPEEQGTP
ncbi:hypothetical protein [Geodermatophilus sp. SYSU D01176]